MLLRSLVTALLVALVAATPARAQSDISPAEARAIAKEAYVYGLPLVDNYRILYAYFVDPANPQYKAPWNQIRNILRVYTSDDKALQSPNSDTPYSWLAMDLRAEPIVLTVPPIEKKRYFSIQLIDSYTFNFDYIGSRTTGNGGGSFLIAGPGWKGGAPRGVRKVIRAETALVLALYRTQLFNPSDLANVRKVQAGYKVQPLSAFLGQSAPKAAPVIDFIKPFTSDQERSSPEFFRILNFALQFCPTHPSEKALMARFARIGVGAGKTFDAGALSPEVQKALSGGIADAWKEYDGLYEQLHAGKITLGETFGTREYLKNKYLYRMLAAAVGIYGNSKEEAIYPVYGVDSNGEPLDAARHRYALRFGPGQLPPVNAFWSLTLYEVPQLLTSNPLNRYLLNSTMLPQFKRDADGGITFYIQHESPGADKEANWLPAPKGPFLTALRLYWPKPEVLDGRWKQPPLQRAQ